MLRPALTEIPITVCINTRVVNDTQNQSFETVSNAKGQLGQFLLTANKKMYQN